MKVVIEFRLIILAVILFISTNCDFLLHDETTPPTVRIITPKDGGIISGLATIRCDVSGPLKIKNINLWIDNKPCGIFTRTKPWNLELNLVDFENGSIHYIQVFAYDIKGNSGSSEVIEVKVDNSTAYPDQVNILNIGYTVEAMLINWEKSDNSSFFKYILSYVITDTSDTVVISEIYDQNKLDFNLYSGEYNPAIETYYFIEIVDIYGFSTISNGYRVLDTTPNPLSFHSIDYGNGAFELTWQSCLENDFQSYSIYDSLSADTNSIIYFTSNRTDTIKSVTSAENLIKNFTLTVSDIWGLQTTTVQSASSWNTFIKRFGDDGIIDVCNSGARAFHGGYILAGYTESTGGNSDVLLIMTDRFGNKIWNSAFGGNDDEIAYSVINNNSTSIMTGSSKTYSHGQRDVWMLAADSEGNELWSNNFGGQYDEVGYHVSATNDGGYMIIGYETSFSDSANNINGQDLYLLRTDNSGNVLWAKEFGDSGNEIGYCVQQTDDAGYILVGTTTSYGTGAKDIWLIKTNYVGIVEWDTTYGGSLNDYAYSVKQCFDGGYIIAGKTNSFGAGRYDAWIIKVDTTGVLEWEYLLGGSQNDMANSIEQTFDNGYIVAGVTNSFGNGKSDAWLVKLDYSGTIVWQKTFGSTLDEVATTVKLASTEQDSGYILFGTSMENDLNGDVLLIKTDLFGNANSE